MHVHVHVIGGPDPLGPDDRGSELTDDRGEPIMGGLSIWHWLIVLLVVVLIFGTKKLRNIGQDLGGAVKGFKDGMKTREDGADAAKAADAAAAADRRARRSKARSRRRTTS